MKEAGIDAQPRESYSIVPVPLQRAIGESIGRVPWGQEVNRRRLFAFVSTAGIAILLIGLATLRIQGPLTARRMASPTEIRINPDARPGPLITEAPPPAFADLWGDPDGLDYIPGAGFTPDAQRVIDITALQLSLLRYQMAMGQYPESLDDLFPTFAPVGEDDQPLGSAPVDPTSGTPYHYRAINGNQDYELFATLSSGKQFTGFSNYGSLRLEA